ncbi:hypothetical protein DFJ74DRAFT_48499 [Hyaloraphidium curvatum]|nr:hypothetical protein DFJ74DRAFT_48499 [Hyaloraphidium curvatum]
MDASPAPHPAPSDAAHGPPTLLPELIRAVFLAADATGHKRTLLECALASKHMLDLALPVLYARIAGRDASAPSFPANARKHAHLVQHLDLLRPPCPPERAAECLSLFPNLRRVGLVFASSEDLHLLDLASRLEHLEHLEVLFSGAYTARRGRFPLPPGLKRLSWSGHVPENGAVFAASLCAAPLLDSLDLSIRDNSWDLFERLAAVPRLVAAIKVLEMDYFELAHAEGLFPSPHFAPRRIGIDLVDFTEFSVLDSLRPLASVQGLGELRLRNGLTSHLRPLRAILPPADVLVLDGFCPSLEEGTLEEVEGMLLGRFARVAVAGMKFSEATRSESEIGKERALWTRVTGGLLP